MSNVRDFRVYAGDDPSEFVKWRNEDIARFDALTDFDNLKTDHDYAATETESGGLYAYTTVITDAGGEEIARRTVAEEAAGLGGFMSYLVTETIQGVTRQWRVAETATGYERKAVE